LYFASKIGKCFHGKLKKKEKCKLERRMKEGGVQFRAGPWGVQGAQWNRGLKVGSSSVGSSSFSSSVVLF